jgi:hypothetical protein
MEINTLTKGPETVFIVVRNDDGSSQAVGTPLEWMTDGTRDGIDVQACQTAAEVSSLIVGCAHVSAADQKYFRAQCYGYDDDAVCYAHGTATNANIAIGDVGIGSSGGALTFPDVGTELQSGTQASEADNTLNVPNNFAAFRTLASHGTSQTTTNHHVFIRCM